MSSIKPRTATVVIYQGDDLARLTELDEAVARAEAADKAAHAPLDQAVAKAERELKQAKERADAGVRLLHQADPVISAQEALSAAEAERDERAVDTAAAVKAVRDNFADEAQERGVKVVLIARQRLRWRELMRAHPPREDELEDVPFGVDMSTLPDVLLPESVDQHMSTIEGDVATFLDSLSDYDFYDRLFVAAFALNRGSATADPTRRLLSASSPTSVATTS